MDHPTTAGPRNRGFALRFTIGQLMLVILLTGLAFAPVAMYRNRAPVELIVATVAFETIGLPALVILVLVATMDPGPVRTRRIVVLSLVPVLLIVATFGIAEVWALSTNFYTAMVRFAYGSPSSLFWCLFVLVENLVLVRFCLPPRCPACRRFKLRCEASPAAGWTRRSTQSLTCKACGARSSRTTYWGYPGGTWPEIHFVETRDS